MNGMLVLTYFCLLNFILYFVLFLLYLLIYFVIIIAVRRRKNRTSIAERNAGTNTVIRPLAFISHAGINRPNILLTPTTVACERRLAASVIR